MFQDLKWTTDDTCQVCTTELPDGFVSYTGTGPGVHVVVVAWTDENGAVRADGAQTNLWQGMVQRLTVGEATEAAMAARDAMKGGNR